LLLGPGAKVPGEELPKGAKLVFDEEHVFSAEMLVERSPTRHAGVRPLSYQTSVKAAHFRDWSRKLNAPGERLL